MSFNKVELCGINTSRLPVLTQEEKESLLLRIREGDADAREAYIKGNLRLVLSVIKRFFRQQRKRGRPFSDRLHRPHESGGQL